MDVSQYLEIFIDETSEHIQSLSDNIMTLEKEPDNKDVINEIFRAAHSLKGMAGTMGFKRMQHLTHDMEDVFQEVRSDRVKVTSDMIDLLFRCLDAIEAYLDCIKESSDEGTEDNESLIQGLNTFLAKAEGKEAAAKLFRKVSEILYLGCLEEDTPYKSFLLLIKYNSEEDGMDSSFFLMNDFVRVVCKDNKVRSLIRIASLMREQTEFVAVWTEKKEDLFSIKRLRGDVWEPFPPEILNEMAHTGERFEEEWEYEMYKIDRNGWLRNDFSDMELDKCRALFGIK